MAAKKNKKKTSRSARKGGGGRKKSKAKKVTKKTTSRSKTRKTAAKKVTSRSKARPKKAAKKVTSRTRKSATRIAAGKRLAAIMRARREGKAAFSNLSVAEKARLRHAKKNRHHARSAPHAHRAVQKPGMSAELRARLLAKYGSPQSRMAASEAAEMSRFA